MITLTTLHKATEQEVFDQVATHLLTQKQKCVRSKFDDDCAYRGKNSEGEFDGLKCAAGCLIADEEYSNKMEGFLWDDLIGSLLVPESHAGLIGKLQEIHDNAEVEDWAKELKKLAKERKLNLKAPIWKSLRSKR